MFSQSVKHDLLHVFTIKNKNITKLLSVMMLIQFLLYSDVRHIFFFNIDNSLKVDNQRHLIKNYLLFTFYLFLFF